MILFVCGCELMWVVRFPPDIHSDTIWRGSKVTPINGTTLGCVKRFHITASLYSICCNR